jgi:hypothetical protein
MNEASNIPQQLQIVRFVEIVYVVETKETYNLFADKIWKK